MGKITKNKKDNKCKICGLNPVAKNGKRWRGICCSCHKKPWVRFRKDYCDSCGFIPVHHCQLDIDHINGNKLDNSEKNLKTLCANCHRLKTQIEKNYLNKH